MADNINEVKTETTWDKVKKTAKKALPWVAGGAACIGTGILVHNMDKDSVKYDADIEWARNLYKYVTDAHEGNVHAFSVENENGKIWGKLIACDKPDWVNEETDVPVKSSWIIDEVNTY